MVTTRGGIETPGAATPRSSTKKKVGKRELEALETPTQVKRLRKAAPTSRPTPKKKVVEETPPPDTSAEESAQEPGEASQTPRRKSPQVVVAKTADVDETPMQEADYHTPEQQSGSVYATPATHFKQKDASPTPKPKTTKDQTPASTKKSRGHPKSSQQGNEPRTIEVAQTTSKFIDDIPSQDTPAPTAQTKKAHMRFGSEEPTETRDTTLINNQGHKRYGAPKATQEAIEDGESDASDSDEAPEMVTTATAATKAKAAQAEANRALQAQQAKEQAKRQAREERIAAQQAAKREREEKKAKKLARKLAKQQVVSDDEDEALQTRLDIDLTMRNLPALLPDSLLSTIDDQRPPTPPPARRGKTEEELRKEKLNHHIKFLERTDKPAKDVKKGKLSVAVIGQHNRALPPKLNRDTRNVREHWLKGRKVQKKKGVKPNFKFGKVERRATGGGGFLRGED